MYLCESMYRNGENTVVLCHPRVAPLGKGLKGKSAVKRKGKQASSLGFTQKRAKPVGEPAWV